jgi:hypothetical protein
MLAGIDDTLKKRSAAIRKVITALAAAKDLMQSGMDEAKRIVVSELGSNVSPELWASTRIACPDAGIRQRTGGLF